MPNELAIRYRKPFRCEGAGATQPVRQSTSSSSAQRSVTPARRRPCLRRSTPVALPRVSAALRTAPAEQPAREPPRRRPTDYRFSRPDPVVVFFGSRRRMHGNRNMPTKCWRRTSGIAALPQRLHRSSNPRTDPIPIRNQAKERPQDCSKTSSIGRKRGRCIAL